MTTQISITRGYPYLEVTGSILENFMDIGKFCQEYCMSNEQLYLSSNLSQNQIETFYVIWNALTKEENLLRFAIQKNNPDK